MEIDASADHDINQVDIKYLNQSVENKPRSMRAERRLSTAFGVQSFKCANIIKILIHIFHEKIPTQADFKSCRAETSTMAQNNKVEYDLLSQV